jgi:hypothetical protein
MAIPLLRCLAFSLLIGTLTPFAAAPAWCATAQELHQGERIYREGILPSGEQLRASVKGEAALPGLTFTCASCHLRSGLGAIDEGIYTPAISGEKLFRHLPRLYKGAELKGDAALPALRPAYTDESLLQLLRSGRDPGGRVLSDLMPRYLLDDRDARLLISYLKTLSAQFSPGVSASEIHFATVVSEDVRPDQRDAMISSFAGFFKMQNDQIRNFGNPLSGSRSRRMAETMALTRDLADKSLSLSCWTLKGAPESWRGQLEEYNRKEPAFALLGGMVTGPWQPIHRFCEENRIPSLFPGTELPVVSETDWYTLYQSKGYYEEGAGAARFLSGKEALLKGGRVVQLVRSSPEAKALAAGFRQAWLELGGKAPVSLELPQGKTVDQDYLHQALTGEKPEVLLVWDDASVLPALKSLGGSKDRPEMVFLSARYLGEDIWSLPEPIRDLSYLTYPFVFSSKVTTKGMAKLIILDDTQQRLKKGDLPVKDQTQKSALQASAVTQLLSGLLMELQGNYYRDNLLDRAGMMADQLHPLYGRLSFGTGQRYASRGCFIVRLSHGDTPELVKQSGWITH